MDSYLLAAEAPDVLTGWCGPVELHYADGWYPEMCLPDGCVTQDSGDYPPCEIEPEHIRLDLEREEVQWLICLRWGPAHDRRGAHAWGDTGICEMHWLSLLGHPDRIVAEVRAVLADLEERRHEDARALLAGLGEGA